MAQAFLNVVLKNLNSLVEREIGLLWGVHKEMEKLSSTLSTIQAVLEDAEQKQFQDKAIQDWLRKLKQAAYAVDDILDECATEAIRLDSKGRKSGLLGKVTSSSISYTPKNISFRHKIGNKMKEITGKLDAIANERMKFHLRELLAPQRVEAIEKRQTSSFLSQLQVYGREEEKEKIVDQLVERAIDCQDVSVYCIIGMGGLGKTTLAKLVFNDEKVTGHFEPRIWVCVSDDFNVKRVVKAILESACGKGCEDLDLDPLQRRLREKLNGKRYLLVLDDVWNEDQEEWDKLKYTLACGSRGASIITTTRLPTVASIMGTLSVHRLSGLSEDDCWSLFKQRAFGNETEEDHSNLVAIGKEIVKRCGGVPLAAKALGGLLRFKRGESEWLSIKESEIWNLPQDENSIMHALRLSYYNLSLELRRCFGYCAIFEKDSKINKKNLIHLWMANGFISTNKKLELEDIGNEIWNELYLRSFFQNVEEDQFNNTVSFMMHDLVHDLAQYVMGDECLVTDVEGSTNISNRNIHHFTLVFNFHMPLLAYPAKLQKVEYLRTFLLQFRHSYQMCSTSMNVSKLLCELTKFGALRVLDARVSKIPKVPSSIGNLKHLRYLDLSKTEIRALPKSICSLWNLQILNLEECWRLQRLPKHLRRLKSLRHLYLKGCPLIHMRPKIGQFTSLQTLTFFIVGKRKGYRLGELQGLNLKGELSIKNLERVGNQVDAKEANLVGKENIRNLSLSWGSNSESELLENVEQLLEALQPNPNVEYLNIIGYMGKKFPLWMSDSVLKNLVSIGLHTCKNCLQLPLFGQLPSLRALEITGMNFVEYIDSDFRGGAAVGGFLSLERLGISRLPNLKGLSRNEGEGLFPCLREIWISACPKLTLPPLSLLGKLRVWGECNNVLVSSISKLNSLTDLVISCNKEVTSFPEQMLQNLSVLRFLQFEMLPKLEVLPTGLANLTALKTLHIARCQEVESFPEQGLQGLHSLQYLTIDQCTKLKSLTEELRHLTSLEKLRMSSCPELVALPEGIKHLYSLRELYISGTGHPESCEIPETVEYPFLHPKMVVLPEALQHVPALQSLGISSYPELTSLPDWLGSLTSLQHLQVRECPNISSLPTSIQSLTKLQTLEIVGCPELARRCKKGSGEDWYKIAHVPKAYISPQ